MPAINENLAEIDDINKCCNRLQLRRWLEIAREDIEEANDEINDAIKQGRGQHQAGDRHFFDRMHRLKRERGKQIHAINTRLHRLRDEPDVSFEEYLLDWIREELGSEAFDRIKESARAGYRKEILGELQVKT